MSRRLPEIQRSIAMPTTGISPGSSFAQLGEASGQLSSVLADITNKASIEESRIQGEKAALEGDAPKNLAPPLTPATRAYNQAVANTEARNMIISANEQIQEAYLRHTDPRNFDHESPLKFKAELDGIRAGYLENARPENRAAITQALDSLQAQSSIKMLEHSIKHDNAVMIQDFESEIANVQNLIKNAYISGAGDEEKQSLLLARQQILNDYATRNAVIAENSDKIQKKFEEADVVDRNLESFSEALATNKQDEWLANLAKNKDNLPYDTFQQVAKEATGMLATHNSLVAGMQSEEYATGQRMINNGQITTVDQIDNQFKNITVAQSQHLKTILETKNQKTSRH